MTDGVALVIGIGNDQRGDDACGLAIARRLQAHIGDAANVCCCEGDATRLMDLWEHRARVILVDMLHIDGAPTGEIRRFDLSEQELPYEVSASSHTLSVAQSIELARTLGRLPPMLEIIGVVGATTELGAPLSGPVETAVRQVVEMLNTELLHEAVNRA